MEHFSWIILGLNISGVSVVMQEEGSSRTNIFMWLLRRILIKNDTMFVYIRTAGQINAMQRFYFLIQPLCVNVIDKNI